MAEHKIAPRSAEEFRLLILGGGLALVLLLLDQITKLLVEQHMQIGESVAFIPGIFQLTYVTNRGAAWGMFTGYGMVLFSIGLAVAVLAIRYLRFIADGFRERYLAVLIVLSGVIGNSADRLWRGAVVDFLDFSFHGHHWPAFNVADCAICIGVGIFFLSVLLRKPLPEKCGASDEAAER